MASKHTCASCTWFARFDYRSYVHDGANGYQPGTCNLNAPEKGGFPPTRDTSFCGQHSALTAPATTEER
jgi:hypothetical protein